MNDLVARYYRQPIDWGRGILMTNVIDGKDRFEFKQLLDGASKNLTSIGEAISSTSNPIAPSIDAALDFGRQFMNWSIKPFWYPLEDSDVLYDIMDTDPERYGQVLRLALKYGGNQAKHDLTLALSQAFPDARLMLITTRDGLTLHSGLWSHENELLLDANGVHSMASLIQNWTGRMLGEPICLKPVSQDDIIELSQCGREGLRQALEDFGALATYMQANMEALTTEPVWDDEPDEADECFPEP
jgi:hypothetical protein